MRLAHLLAAAFVTSLLAGCGGAGAATSLGPRPAARLGAGAADSVPASTTLADGFHACGATQVPPASVLVTAPRDLPPVLNATTGGVDDPTARQWAAAFWREQAIESWAAGPADQQGLLRGPCLSAARVRLAVVPGGRPAGRPRPCGGETCLVLRLTVATTTLPMLQALVLRHGGNPSRYVVLETVLAAGQVDTLAVGGLYQDGPIGPIWFIEATGLDCLDPDAKRLGLDCGAGASP
jgi:hypothetical protein